MKKIIIGTLLLIIIIALAWVIHYAWTSFPIVSAFNAKQVCTCVFVSNRTIESLDTTEMGEFPSSLGKYQINVQDSSVTSSIWGMVKRKAIYRKGIGCTLLNGASEKQLRSQTFNIPQPPVINADTIAWPIGDKIADTISSEINITALNAAVDNVFTEPYTDKKQRTRAVVVVYNGQLVVEKYAPGFDKNTKMYGWSMGKSFTSALIGTLVKAGAIDVKAPAPVDEWKDINDPRHKITTENLLQQTSGLDFIEDYSKASDATIMLFEKQDAAAFTAQHSLAHTPGTVFYYSSGNSNILSRIIRQKVGEKDYAAYPFTALLYKVGMYNTVFEPDASGTYVGSSFINATARDYARFGLLYYNDGVWNGERILPEDWVKQTTTPATASRLKIFFCVSLDF